MLFANGVSAFGVSLNSHEAAEPLKMSAAWAEQFEVPRVSAQLARPGRTRLQRQGTTVLRSANDFQSVRGAAAASIAFPTLPVRRLKPVAHHVPQRGAGSRRGGAARNRLALTLSPLPNPSLKGSANGRPPGPGQWYAVHFHWPGPGILPLAPP